MAGRSNNASFLNAYFFTVLDLGVGFNLAGAALGVGQPVALKDGATRYDVTADPIAYHVTLLPRFRDGSITTATEQLRQAMAREAVPLALSLPPLRRLATIPEVPVTITNFTATVIQLIAAHA